MAATHARTAAKRTYSLDSELVDRFEGLGPVGQRSQRIEDMLARRGEEIETKRLKAEIRDGLSDMSEVSTDTAVERRPLRSIVRRISRAKPAFAAISSASLNPRSV